MLPTFAPLCVSVVFVPCALALALPNGSHPTTSPSIPGPNPYNPANGKPSTYTAATIEILVDPSTNKTLTTTLYATTVTPPPGIAASPITITTTKGTYFQTFPSGFIISDNTNIPFAQESGLVLHTTVAALAPEASPSLTDSAEVSHTTVPAVAVQARPSWTSTSATEISVRPVEHSTVPSFVNPGPTSRSAAVVPVPTDGAVPLLAPLQPLKTSHEGGSSLQDAGSVGEDAAPPSGSNEPPGVSAAQPILDQPKEQATPSVKISPTNNPNNPVATPPKSPNEPPAQPIGQQTQSPHHQTTPAPNNAIPAPRPQSPPPATPAKITIAGQTYTANPSSAYIISEQTLKPAGPAIILSGKTISLGPSASNIVIDGRTTPIALPVASASAPEAAAITPHPQAPTPDASSHYVIGGQTLLPGGPAITANGTRVSLAPGASDVVVGSKTEALGGLVMSGFRTGMPSGTAGVAGVASVGTEPFAGGASALSGCGRWARCMGVVVLGVGMGVWGVG